MKPIIELIVKGGDEEKVAAVACGQCRCVARSTAEAESCCMPRKCKTCGEETGTRYELECSSCRYRKWDKEARAREAEAFNKATKIPAADYKGDQVCLSFSPDEDDYYALGEIESVEDKAWVWGCVSVPWPRPDMLRTMESEIEGEFPIDVLDWLDMDSLQSAVNEWFDANAPEPHMYMIDPTTVVILDPKNTPDQMEVL